MVIGTGLFLESLLYMDIRQYMLILILVFGGIIPTVMTLKVNHWMKYQCAIRNFISEPSYAEYITDWICFILAIAGFAV